MIKAFFTFYALQGVSLHLSNTARDMDGVYGIAATAYILQLATFFYLSTML